MNLKKFLKNLIIENQLIEKILFYHIFENSKIAN